MKQIDFGWVLAPRYRAVWLDLAAFVFNLVALLFLTDQLANLAHQAGAGNLAAKQGMAIFCLGLAFLQPVGTLLKRRSFHQRHPNLNSTFVADHRRWILPVYFLLQVMLLIFASTLAVEAAGSDYESPGWLFAALFFGIPAAAAANTYIVYSYFLPPQRDPLQALMRTPPPEILGDACLFINMLGFQAMWWYLLADPYFSTRPGSVGQLTEKLFFFFCLALFFYLPPRLCYWAESPPSKTTGYTIVLSNLPVIFKIVIGMR
jgi:hypothetical protein